MPEPLPYVDASADAVRIGRRTALIARSSIAFALLAFPVGALVSIVLENQPKLVSNALAQRAGFMLFAIMEGLAAACGFLAVVWSRRRKNSAHRTAVTGAVLGALGSAIVLFMIFRKAI